MVVVESVALQNFGFFMFWIWIPLHIITLIIFWMRRKYFPILGRYSSITPIIYPRSRRYVNCCALLQKVSKYHNGIDGIYDSTNGIFRMANLATKTKNTMLDCMVALLHCLCHIPPPPMMFRVHMTMEIVINDRWIFVPACSSFLPVITIRATLLLCQVHFAKPLIRLIVTYHAYPYLTNSLRYNPIYHKLRKFALQSVNVIKE
jgi:hypothetical protein